MYLLKKMSVVLIAVLLFPASAFAEVGGPFDSYPVNSTFTISAYYSPLPCQMSYVTGSYAGDIRLNGSGVNGASGRGVFPGMLAAPRNYAFGTKMQIPGIGMASVQDRGGAIVNAGERNQAYDRLDVWMGYGDTGRQRALNWGKRVVDVVVYGVNDAIEEDIYLPGYSLAEKSYDCGHLADSESFEEKKVVTFASSTVKKKSEVSKLQDELRNFYFYRGEATGVYDSLTRHAVFKFQQSQDIVIDNESMGAGVFGPATRKRLNEILAARYYSEDKVALATEEFEGKMLTVEKAAETVAALTSDVVEENEDVIELAVAADSVLSGELDFDDNGPEVYKLQKFLKEKGYFRGPFLSTYFGYVTRDAVLAFQMDNGIVDSDDVQGAGRVGPSTLVAINTF